MERLQYPSQAEIKQYLNYNPNTGFFTWKARQRTDFPSGQIWGDACSTWNTRFDGENAGCVNRGYIVIRLKDCLYQAHKLAYIYMNGAAEADDIDHINGVKNDNRIANLRAVSRSENQQNNGLQSNNTSGVKGISFDNRLNKWHAYIKKDRKRHHIGMFDKKIDAVKARYEAEIKFGFTDINPDSTAHQYLQGEA